MEKVSRLIFFILIYVINTVINFFIFLYNCQTLVFDFITLINSGEIEKESFIFC